MKPDLQLGSAKEHVFLALRGLPPTKHSLTDLYKVCEVNWVSKGFSLKSLKPMVRATLQRLRDQEKITIQVYRETHDTVDRGYWRLIDSYLSGEYIPSLPVDIGVKRVIIREIPEHKEPARKSHEFVVFHTMVALRSRKLVVHEEKGREYDLTTYENATDTVTVLKCQGQVSGAELASEQIKKAVSSLKDIDNPERLAEYNAVDLDDVAFGIVIETPPTKAVREWFDRRYRPDMPGGIDLFWLNPEDNVLCSSPTNQSPLSKKFE